MADEKRPVFGVDYDLGWVGFVHGPELLSGAIAYLTRRDRKGDVTVTHAFLVTGPDEGVEANLPAGVVASELGKSYFDVPDRHVVFRKPRGLTPEAGRRVAQRAKAQVGAGFDFGGFVAEGLTDTFLGHLLDSLFGGDLKRATAAALHLHGRYICSGLIAYCLRPEEAYRGHPALAEQEATLTPQALFEEETLWEPLPPPATCPPDDA